MPLSKEQNERCGAASDSSPRWFQPWVQVHKNHPSPGRGGKQGDVENLFRPCRGLFPFIRKPTARAVGYFLLPLRGCHCVTEKYCLDSLCPCAGCNLTALWAGYLIWMKPTPRGCPRAPRLDGKLSMRRWCANDTFPAVAAGYGSSATRPSSPPPLPGPCGRKPARGWTWNCRVNGFTGSPSGRT